MKFIYQGLVGTIILPNRPGGYGSRNLSLLGRVKVHLHDLQALDEELPGPDEGLVYRLVYWAAIAAYM